MVAMLLIWQFRLDQAQHVIDQRIAGANKLQALMLLEQIRIGLGIVADGPDALQAVLVELECQPHLAHVIQPLLAFSIAVAGVQYQQFCGGRQRQQATFERTGVEEQHHAERSDHRIEMRRVPQRPEHQQVGAHRPDRRRRPAGQDVRGVMDAQVDSADADQERENHGDQDEV